MGNDTNTPMDELRKRAEAGLPAGKDVPEEPPQSTAELIQELRTYQLELEMQNKELRASERELSDTRDRLSHLYDFAPVGYVTLSDKGLVVQANLTLSKLLGMDRSRLIGESFSTFVTAEDQDIYYMHRKKVLESEQQQGAELRLNKSGGGPFWASLETSITEASDQQGRCLLMSISDISERHLLKGKLRQAEKMEAIGTLVGGIAHEFNNMLAAITGSLYVARDDAKSLPKVTRRIDDIEKLCFRAADMIVHLLTFSRANTVHIMPLDLTAFIKEAIKLGRVSIPENIRLEVATCVEKLVIPGDATQIQQILMNLLGNARDAVAHADQPTISVSLAASEPGQDILRRHPELDGTHFACLSVSDNGCGMSGQTMQHLFDPYFTTKEVGKGSGLGLAMVHGAVQTHKGAIEVESRVNEGSCFRIYLPLYEGETGVLTEEKEAIEEGQGETILLVDDDSTVCEAMAGMLKNLGYRVLTAANGQQGVERFREQTSSIDLVILDVVMPGMGGVVAAQQMCSLRPDLPVIFSSGYDMKYMLTGSDHPPNSVGLGKPIPIAELSRTIRAMLAPSTGPS